MRERGAVALNSGQMELERLIEEGPPDGLYGGVEDEEADVEVAQGLDERGGAPGIADVAGDRAYADPEPRLQVGRGVFEDVLPARGEHEVDAALGGERGGRQSDARRPADHERPRPVPPDRVGVVEPRGSVGLHQWFAILTRSPSVRRSGVRANRPLSIERT